MKRKSLIQTLRSASLNADRLLVEQSDTDLISRDIAVLIALAKKPGSTTTTLAEELDFDLSTTSRAIRRLVGFGYLKYDRRNPDARSKSILMTGTGSSCAEKLITAENKIETLIRRATKRGPLEGRLETIADLAHRESQE